MASHQLAPGVTSSTLTSMSWRSYSLALGFGISIPLFFATSYAWVLWIVIPFLVRIVHRLRDRHSPGTAAHTRS
jgi:hypothetical protein